MLTDVCDAPAATRAGEEGTLMDVTPPSRQPGPPQSSPTRGGGREHGRDGGAGRAVEAAEEEARGEAAAGGGAGAVAEDIGGGGPGSDRQSFHQATTERQLEQLRQAVEQRWERVDDVEHLVGQMQVQFA